MSHGPLRRRRLNVELLKQKSDSRKRNITQPNQVRLLNIRQSKNNNLSERATHILRSIQISLILCDLLLECKVNVVYFDKEDSTRSFQTTLRRNFQEEQFLEGYKVLSGISLVEEGLPVLHLLTLSKRKPEAG